MPDQAQVVSILHRVFDRMPQWAGLLVFQQLLARQQGEVYTHDMSLREMRGRGKE